MRLRKRRDYLGAQQHPQRRKHHGRHFLVIVAPRSDSGSREPWGRIGITVSKKVGNAVVRNRVKRWVREFVRTNPSWLPSGRDVVVIAKRSASTLRRLADVDADLRPLERRL